MLERLPDKERTDAVRRQHESRYFGSKVFRRRRSVVRTACGSDQSNRQKYGEVGSKWRHLGTLIATREKRRLFAKSKERSGLQYRTRHAIVHFTEEGQPETGKPGGNSRWTSQGNLRQLRGNLRRLDEIRHRSGNGSHPATGYAERWCSRAQGLRPHSRLRSGVSDGKCEPRFVLSAQLAEQPERRPKGRRDGGRAGGRKTVKAGIENTPRGLRLPWGFSRLGQDHDRRVEQRCRCGS
jgi:hypothetical protein